MPGIRSAIDLSTVKQDGKTISMVTCYDYIFAGIIEHTGIDAILVHDSLGTFFAGHDSNLPVTVDQIIYHADIVRRGAPSKFVIAGLPFMSYEVSVEDAVRNSGKIIKRSGIDAVMLHGGADFRNVVEQLVKASIPVIGHVEFASQTARRHSANNTGSDYNQRTRIAIESARILEEAGASAVILEMLPGNVAGEITDDISIPTIGIGSGKLCNGQLLSIYDLLGLNEGSTGKHIKSYANLHETAMATLSEFDREVKEGAFPE